MDWEQEPRRLGWFWVNGAAAIGLGVWAWYDTALPHWVAIAATLLALLCAASAVLNLLRWIGDNLAENYRARKEAEAITPEILFVKALRGLTLEAILYLDHRQQALVLVNDEEGDEIYLRTEYGMVPHEFVKVFFDYPDPVMLRPIGFYPEGKKDPRGNELRDLARILTRHAVSMEWAVAARGNQAARWVPGQRIVAMHRMRVIT